MVNFTENVGFRGLSALGWEANSIASGFGSNYSVTGNSLVGGWSINSSFVPKRTLLLSDTSVVNTNQILATLIMDLMKFR